MKRTILKLMVLLLFFSQHSFLGAMDNNNSITDPNDIPMRGRCAYVGFSGEGKFSPGKCLYRGWNYMIGGIWYKYKGYDFSLKGHLFYKNDDEQLVINRDKEKKWFVTKECKKKDNSFQPVEGEAFVTHSSDSESDSVFSPPSSIFSRLGNDNDRVRRPFSAVSSNLSLRRRRVNRCVFQWAFTIGMVLFLKWRFERKWQKGKMQAAQAAQEKANLNNEAIVS